jgi:hypothetical protein
MKRNMNIAACDVKKQNKFLLNQPMKYLFTDYIVNKLKRLKI